MVALKFSRLDPQRHGSEQENGARHRLSAETFGAAGSTPEASPRRVVSLSPLLREDRRALTKGECELHAASSKRSKGPRSPKGHSQHPKGSPDSKAS